MNIINILACKTKANPSSTCTMMGFIFIQERDVVFRVNNSMKTSSLGLLKISRVLGISNKTQEQTQNMVHPCLNNTDLVTRLRQEIV